MGTLDGKVALVTGGGCGIGRGISLAFAREGAAVVVDDVYSDDSGAAAELVAREIDDAGGRARGLREDVTTAQGADAMVRAAVETFGGLDILVTCAGNYLTGDLQDMTDEQFDRLLNLHLRGTFMPTRAALRHMLEKDSGRIVMVGSRGAFLQLPQSKTIERDERAKKAGPNCVYNGAKAGVMGMANNLAFETWDTGITVNTLLPSASTQLFPSKEPRMLGGTPATESLDPEDVAPTVVFLCGPAAANISGRAVYAAGGDVAVFGEQLSMAGSRMVRKQGRWTPGELSAVLPSLLGVPVG